MDHLSGGTLDYAQLMLESAESNANDFHEPQFRAAANSPIPFVPTASALGLPLETDDADLATAIAQGEPPFDDVYAIGDLTAYPSNVDHNTIVVPDALLTEIVATVTCWDGAEQGSDIDFHGVRAECGYDTDEDGVADFEDNCPEQANADQRDADANGSGDVCDPDVDGDGTSNAQDNCPKIANERQYDSDGDAVGDACDASRNAPVESGGCGTFPPTGGSVIVLAILGLRRLRRQNRSRSVS